MKIITIVVGKRHDRTIKDAIAVYEKRLTKFCDLSWDIIPPSSVDVESLAIEKRLQADDYVILLDETGQVMDNNELSEKIEILQNDSVRRLVFIIGGAYGVNYNLMGKANLVLSFSKLVFPHQLMRLMLIEQLYRSYSIISGSKYHHD